MITSQEVEMVRPLAASCYQTGLLMRPPTASYWNWPNGFGYLTLDCNLNSHPFEGPRPERRHG